MYILFLYQYLFTCFFIINQLLFIIFFVCLSFIIIIQQSSFFVVVAGVCVYCLSVMHRINTRNLGLFIYQFFLLSQSRVHPSFSSPFSFLSHFDFLRIIFVFSLYSLFHQNIRLWCVCVCLCFLYFVIGEARNHKTIQSFHPSLFCFAYLHDDDDDKHR